MIRWQQLVGRELVHCGQLEKTVQLGWLSYIWAKTNMFRLCARRQLYRRKSRKWLNSEPISRYARNRSAYYTFDKGRTETDIDQLHHSNTKQRQSPTLYVSKAELYVASMWEEHRSHTHSNLRMSTPHLLNARISTLATCPRSATNVMYM